KREAGGEDTAVGLGGRFSASPGSVHGDVLLLYSAAARGIFGIVRSGHIGHRFDFRGGHVRPSATRRNPALKECLRTCLGRGFQKQGAVVVNSERHINSHLRPRYGQSERG